MKTIAILFLLTVSITVNAQSQKAIKSALNLSKADTTLTISSFQQADIDAINRGKDEAIKKINEEANGKIMLILTTIVKRDVDPDKVADLKYEPGKLIVIFKPQTK